MNRSGPFLADFHIHSTFSDGKLHIPQLVDLYGRLGFGAIAITDHLCEDETTIGKVAGYIGHTLTPATYPLYLEILKSEAARAWDQYGMVVIPGFELTKNTVTNSRSAHMLGIGVEEFISANGDVVDLARKIRAAGGISVAAHPVSTRKTEKQTYHLWNRRDELALELDAWEVASGPYLFEEVRDSGLPMLATSDLHRPEQINAWKTRLDCERHPQAILEAIRKQRLSFVFYNHGDFSHDLARLTSRDPLGPDPSSPSHGNVVVA